MAWGSLDVDIHQSSIASYAIQGQAITSQSAIETSTIKGPQNSVEVHSKDHPLIHDPHEKTLSLPL